MDCRKFHRNLEDYLEDGLDFPGRFGMERHARQCIYCGKALSHAQKLSQMARQMERVKAPVNFETTILRELGKRDARGGLWGLRRFWLYGFELPPVRKLALASSCFAVLALGALYLVPTPGKRAIPDSPALQSFRESVPAEQKVNRDPEVVTVAAQSEFPVAAVSDGAKEAPAFPVREPELVMDREVFDADYLEFRVIGPDNRPVSFRFPNKPRTRYGQTDEEYFLRNVSH